MERLLLRPDEAREMLGLGRTKFNEMLRRGEIPGVIRFNRSVRISHEALREWIRELAASS